MENKIREIAKKLLTEGQVDFVIGYGRNPMGAIEPIFVSKLEDVNKLTWSYKDCYNNLAVYLTKDLVKNANKVAIVAKGCDVKSIVGLIQENQIKREKVVIIGMSGNGIGEPLLKKCKNCDVKTPRMYDYLIGDSISPEPIDKYAEVEEFDKKSCEEKRAFWDEQLAKCTKCYACRAVCPLCYCSRCIVEKNQPQWIPTSPHKSGNFIWNFMRSFHLAGRCIGCDECERVCPENIPLSLINKKIAQEVKENFNYEAGYDLEQKPPLVCFEKEDNQEFIR